MMPSKINPRTKSDNLIRRQLARDALLGSEYLGVQDLGDCFGDALGVLMMHRFANNRYADVF